jgi:hypothetical protein
LGAGGGCATQQSSKTGQPRVQSEKKKKTKRSKAEMIGVEKRGKNAAEKKPKPIQESDPNERRIKRAMTSGTYAHATHGPKPKKPIDRRRKTAQKETKGEAEPRTTKIVEEATHPSPPSPTSGAATTMGQVALRIG